MSRDTVKKGLFFTWIDIIIIIAITWLSSYFYHSEISKEEVPLEIITPKDNIAEYFPSEYETIYQAALRNGLSPEQEMLLFAIRKAENGPAGLEFGVMSPYAKNTNLDRQAGACAFEIARHAPEVTEQAILAFADRYCPPSVDRQGNENWKRNVIFWFIKLGGKL